MKTTVHIAHSYLTVYLLATWQSTWRLPGSLPGGYLAVCLALPRSLPGGYLYEPVDMKNGTRNLPERIQLRRLCKVVPSNGKAPHTST